MTRLAAGLADTPGSVFPCRVLGQGLASVSQPLVCPSSALSAAACPQLWRELIQLLARFPRRSRHCIIATAAPTVRVHEACTVHVCAPPAPPRTARLPPAVTQRFRGTHYDLYLYWISFVLCFISVRCLSFYT